MIKSKSKKGTGTLRRVLEERSEQRTVASCNSSTSLLVPTGTTTKVSELPVTTVRRSFSTLPKRGVVLACFSPPVMVATFAIEIFIALYIVLRFKLNPKGRAILGLLVCLAAFQLAEFFVCTQSSIGILASRAGYMAITLLPAFGLYLMSLLTIPMQRRTHIAVFGSTFLVAMYFLLAPNAFNSYECTGNYVIFQMGFWSAYAYGLFYYSLLAAAIWRGFAFLKQVPKSSSAAAVRWLLAGYGVFIVPVAILTVIHPDTRQALPSLLCGFAILLAIILGARIAPLSLEDR